MTYDEALKLYFEGYPKAAQPNEQMSKLISGQWYLRNNLEKALAHIGTVIRTVTYHGPNTQTKRYVPPYFTLREEMMYRAWAKGYRTYIIAKAFSVSQSHARIVLMEVDRKLDALVAERAA